jgi:hypothetical protein
MNIAILVLILTSLLAAVLITHAAQVMQVAFAQTTNYKLLRAKMLSYVSQSLQTNIYKPVLKLQDFVDMQRNVNNLAAVKTLAQSKGVCFGGSFFSLSAIKQYAPIIKQNGGCQVGYDLESGTGNTPTAELANPVGSMTSAANIAHSNGLKLVVDSSRALTTKYAAQFAKVADLYNIQAQALESTPSSYISYVKNEAAIIKAAHPGMPVIAETSTTRGTVSQMEQCFAGVAPYVDGSATWFSSDTTNQLQQFITWFAQRYH